MLVLKNQLKFRNRTPLFSDLLIIMADAREKTEAEQTGFVLFCFVWLARGEEMKLREEDSMDGKVGAWHGGAEGRGKGLINFKLTKKTTAHSVTLHCIDHFLNMKKQKALKFGQTVS